MLPDGGGRVDVVVVTFESEEHIGPCLASLRAEGVRAVVVADNASEDGTATAVAAADSAARFLPLGANLGYGRAVNRGAAALGDAPSGADVLLVINPDTVVHPGALSALVAALDADPGLGIVGPAVVNTDGSLYPSARTFPDLLVATGHAFFGLVAPRNRFSRRYKLLDWDHTTARRVDWVSGSAFCIRRSVFDAVGGFDEAFFMYMEDVDLCWRLGRAGWGVGYEPAATVTHVQGVSTDRQPYRMIVEHHRSLLRWSVRTSTGARRLLLPVVAVVLALRAGLALLHRATAGQRLQRRLRRAGVGSRRTH